MIGSLRGELLERWSDGEVLVEAAGVGYRVVVSAGTSASLGEPGAPVFLHIHHHRREDAETLYGFSTSTDRLVFESLLGAHGVGPSLALAILAVHPPTSLVRVLADDDLDALCLVPGVGKKTAARLLVELKSRLDVPGLDVAAVVAAGGDGAASPSGTPVADVRDALGELGYGPDEVAEAVRDLPHDVDAAELLRLALRRLAA